MTLFTISLIVFFGSVLIGVLSEIAILARLKKLGKTVPSKMKKQILLSIRGFVVLWFIVLGCSIALRYVSFAATTEQLIFDALFIIFVASLSIPISRVCITLLYVYTKQITGAIQTTSILNNIIRLIVIVLAVSVILNHFGVTIAPLLTAFGISGLAVALALQPTLSNLFSGLQIVFSRNIQPGDYVKLESGEEGRVVDVTWRHAQIQDMFGHCIIVPNGKLALATLTNYDLGKKEGEIRLKIQIAQSNNLAQVEEVTRQVVESILKSVISESASPPSIRFTHFTGTTIELMIHAVIQLTVKEEQYTVQHEMIKALNAAFQQKNIELAK